MKRPTASTSDGPASPRALLSQRRLRPKRSFGQNFLVDEQRLEAIARAVLSLRKDEGAPVVELGAGTGALTGVLLAAGATVHAVERDRDLVPLLEERFAEKVREGRLVVHEANAATFRFEEVLEGRGVLCGNLPYQLTSTLLLRAMEGASSLAGAVFLVQLEVAERLAAEPGAKDYGVLSVLLQHRLDVRLIGRVPKGAFWPIPEVDGGVVELVPLEIPRGGKVPFDALKDLVKRAFHQRRKRLKNTLAPLGGEALLLAAGVDPGLRAERLSVEDFVRLAKARMEREGRHA